MTRTPRRWGAPIILAALLVGSLPAGVRAAAPVAIDDPVAGCQGGPMFGGGSFPIPEDWKGGSPAGFESYFPFIGGLTCSPLTNDTDADDDSLTIASVTDGPHGHVIIIDPTSVAYAPDPDWSTPQGDWDSDTFTYTATDGTTESNTATMHIWLAPINDPPTFTPGPTVTVGEDSGPYSGAWATAISPGPANESDQNVAFDVTDVDDDGLGLFLGPPAIATDGTLTLTPAANARGIAHVTVQAQDDGGLEDWDMNPAWIDAPDDTSDPVTFDIVVTAAPEAVDDPNETTTEDTQAILHVLDNDVADGPGMVVTGVSDPAKAPPRSSRRAGSFKEGDGPIAVPLLGNDQDIDGDVLKISATSNGSLGTAAVTGGGTGLTYDPNPLASGSDTFTYTVSDGHGGTDTATVLVTITPDTAPPVLSNLREGIAPQTLATDAANTTKVDLSWAGTDAGSGVARYLLQVSVDGGQYSSIALSSPTATTGTRALTIGHIYQFRVRATDREGNVSAYNLWPTITPGRHKETSTLVTYVGTWTSVSSPSKSGGASRSVTATSARARLSFTGRDVGWVATRGTAGGRADVYLDGKRIATVDLHATTAQYRVMVLRWHFATKAAHVLELRPLGDGRIDLDAFVVLR